MSTLNTTNLKNPSSGSNNVELGTSGQTTVNGDLLFNSGYGSAATAYGCRAWVNFNGTGTVAIRASGNVSSITDNGVGDYTVNFTTAMVDANYAVTGMVRSTSGGSATLAGQTGSTTWQQPGGVRVHVLTTAGVLVDAEYTNVAIFR